MAFLSGVLSNIQKHLGQHKEEITEAIKSLETNKHAGKKGFNDAIAEVVKGVRKYNGFVKTSNERVSKPVVELLSYFTEESPGKFRLGFNAIQVDEVSNDPTQDQQVTNAGKLVADCLKNANRFNDTFNIDKPTNNIKNAINDLNHKLRERVYGVRETVKYETDRLTQLSTMEHENLEAVTKFIATELQCVKDSVNSKVETEVNGLVNQLKLSVQMMLHQLEKISQALHKYVTELGVWIGKAEDLASQALGHLKRQLAEVNEGISDKNPALIKSAVEQIKVAVLMLKGAGEEAKMKVEMLVPQALKQVKEMDGKLKEDLFGVKKAVEGQVTEIKNKIGELNETVRGIPGRAVTEKDKKIENIIQQIKSEVAGIRGSSGPRVGDGLSGIKQKVKDYVENFKNFETKVLNTWMDDIITKDPVKTYIGSYMKNNPGKFKSRGTNGINDEVKHYIKEKLHNIAEHARATLTTDNNVTGDLTKIKEFLDTFAAGLSNTIKTNEIKSREIENQMEAKHVLNGLTHNTEYLSAAVTATLNQMHGRFKGAAQEIRNLLDSCSFKNVDSAHNKAKELVEKLEKVIGLPSGSGNINLAADVDSAITQVNAELKKHFSEETGNKQGTHVKLGKDSFTNYKAFVAQTDKLTAAASDAENLEGTLPAAIKKIRDQVKEAVKDIEKRNSEADEMFNELTTKLAALCDIIKEDGGYAKGNLEILNNTYFMSSTNYAKEAQESIKRIKFDLEELKHTQLNEAMEKARQFLTEAPKAGQKIIDGLKLHVNGDVGNAKSTITKHVRQHYVTAIKLQLDQFANKVNDVLKELPGLIESDKQVAFKGFMKNLYISFNANIVPKKDELKLDVLSEAFHKFVEPLHAYLKAEIGRQNDDNHAKKHPSSQRSTNYYVDAVDCVQNELEKLIHQIRAGNRYDHHVPRLLDGLTDAINGLHPESFCEPSTPLLETVAHGFRGLVGELRFAYISSYDGAAYDFKWDVDGRKCAKVFMTCLPTWVENLGEVNRRCMSGASWEGKSIYLKENNNRVNQLGEFLRQCGYHVPTSETSTHDGELQCKNTFNGGTIRDRFLQQNVDSAVHVVKHLKECGSNKDEMGKTKITRGFNVIDLLSCCYHHLETYNDVCHVSTLTAKRHPCSAYEMLVWLSGLTHSPVYASKLHVTIFQLLEELYKRGRPDDQQQEAGDDIHIEVPGDDPIKVSQVDMNAIPLEGSPKNVSYREMCDAVSHICATAYDVLCTIAGHGDAYTTYASDYSNNSMKFYYPASGEDCFDMLVNILRRLFPILRFMETQCSDAASGYGWAQCRYGKNIATTKSRCNDHSTDKPTCQAKCRAECQPNDQPKCQPNCQVSCQPTSPLMSYLNDCLPGHLPHSLSKIGCKYECVNCPSTLKKGMPCLTPLGFRGFSGSARTGREICDIIRKFFSNRNLSSLLCLQPTPPSTLAEHFDFVMSLVSKWQSKGTDSLDNKIESAITDMTINLHTASADFKNALSDAYGRSQIRHERTYHFPAYADLCSLSMNTICNEKDIHCAPYLYCLSSDSSYYLAEKHVETYLSWAVYLPWKFHEYLANLFDALKTILCRDWDCRPCLSGDKCRGGQHGLSDEKTKAAYCQCPSVVQCNGVLPIIYKYGFTFGQAGSLMANNITCTNFCDQLNNVITSDYFTKLFNECDNFLYYIRFPFMTLTLALWLLSLLYLLHIMVIRLDLLHIISHLHSPSSHRVAAQSLLAAARVNKLGRVFYLQP